MLIPITRTDKATHFPSSMHFLPFFLFTFQRHRCIIKMYLRFIYAFEMERVFAADVLFFTLLSRYRAASHAPTATAFRLKPTPVSFPITEPVSECPLIAAPILCTLQQTRLLCLHTPLSDGFSCGYDLCDDVPAFLFPRFPFRIPLHFFLCSSLALRYTVHPSYYPCL